LEHSVDPKASVTQKRVVIAAALAQDGPLDRAIGVLSPRRRISGSRSGFPGPRSVTSQYCDIAYLLLPLHRLPDFLLRIINLCCERATATPKRRYTSKIADNPQTQGS